MRYFLFNLDESNSILRTPRLFSTTRLDVLLISSAEDPKDPVSESNSFVLELGGAADILVGLEAGILQGRRREVDER